jgi:hypothetical protein
MAQVLAFTGQASNDDEDDVYTTVWFDTVPDNKPGTPATGSVALSQYVEWSDQADARVGITEYLDDSQSSPVNNFFRSVFHGDKVTSVRVFATCANCFMRYSGMIYLGTGNLIFHD